MTTIRSHVPLLIASLSLAGWGVALAQTDSPWPLQIDATEGRILIYQPQPESFEGDVITSRAAVSFTAPEKEPVFGAVWMSARVATDRDTRTVDILDIEMKKVKFPEDVSTEEQRQRFAEIVEAAIPQYELSMSLDRLLTTLGLADTAQIAADDLKTDPPHIVFFPERALLVSIDGEPKLEAIDDSMIMRVVNSAFTILHNPKNRAYYLFAGENAWYTASEIIGSWSFTESVPDSVSRLISVDPDAERPEEPVAEGADADADAGPPKIIVATEPTELISTDGEPTWVPVNGTDLLYVSNTDSDVLMDVATQQYYVLLSGRWYLAGSMDGPWTFLPSDELPDTFVDIPDDSAVGGVRTFVAGTDEAQDAVLDNYIPQTSAVKRGMVSLEIQYDGEPKFEPIEDTDMFYAVNTSAQVIQSGKKYYACHEAVWYVSDDPQGPWEVCDDVPDEIYTIPASNPNYNVKYVYVYDSTPEVVYVGYTPGYTGSYVYHTTVVYGTGWYYPAWYGTLYYPRPSTWGFHVRFNPWTGWGFGISYSSGPFTFTFGFGGWYRYPWHRRWGWWGGYHRGFRHGYHRGFHHGYRHGARAGYRAGYRAGNRNSNIYNRPENRDRNVPQTQDRKRPSSSDGRPNNVYADRDGDVHRRNENGDWEQRSKDGWEPSQGAGDRPPTADRSKPSTGEAGADRSRPSTGEAGADRSRPSTGQTGADRSRPSTGGSSYDRGGGSSSNREGSSQLDRSYQSRQRGSQRTQSYGRSRGGGGGRGRRP